MAGQQNAVGPWRKYVTSDTLNGLDLQGRNHVVVIERVIAARMADRNDPEKDRGVLNVYFRGKRKPLVVKAELSSVLTKLAGTNECQKWIGMAIEIYPYRRKAFGAWHDVVGISPKRPTAEQAKIAGARAPEPEPEPTDLEPDEIREYGESGPPDQRGPTRGRGDNDQLTDADKRAIEMAEAAEAQEERRKRERDGR